MANTRFNYDKCRTNKLLQEATGPGRYMLNTPGPAHSLVANNDPHYRLQRWVGVQYHPETELESHYGDTIMLKQFDKIIFVDKTNAI